MTTWWWGKICTFVLFLVKNSWVPQHLQRLIHSTAWIKICIYTVLSIRNLRLLGSCWAHAVHKFSMIPTFSHHFPRTNCRAGRTQRKAIRLSIYWHLAFQLDFLPPMATPGQPRELHKLRPATDCKSLIRPIKLADTHPTTARYTNSTVSKLDPFQLLDISLLHSHSVLTPSNSSKLKILNRVKSNTDRQAFLFFFFTRW